MIADGERLVVTLEANLAKYRTDLAQGQALTNQKLAGIEARYATFAAKLKGSTAAAGAGLGTMFAGIGAALGVSAVVEYANSWTKVTRGLEGSEQAFGITLKSASELNALANDARVDLDAYTKLYTRTSAAIRDYGFEAGTAERVTSTLSKALKLGGANAGEQTSVLLQFSQALQKGKLDGDEFRTVMENAGIVQELLAKRLNVTKGEIIRMAAAGKLQIKDLVGAMVDGGAQVDRIFRQMPVTVDEAFTVLRNNFIEFIGKADQATGATQALSAGIVTISQNLGVVAVAAGAILSSATLRMVAFAAASVSAANPLTLIAATIGGLATAYGVFGDEVKISSDGVVSLKDALNAFLEVAGDGATTGANGLIDAMLAMKQEADASGISFSNFAAQVVAGGQSIVAVASDIDANFGGIGAKIASAFVEGNKALAETLGITQALAGAMDAANRVADRAQKIALQRGIAEGPNLGQGLADFRAGKITDRKKDPGTAGKDEKRSEFEREADQIRKRTEALRADIAVIGQSTFAQEKAKASAELRFAAAQTASKQGRAVTQAELEAIEKLSAAYANTQVQVQFLNKLQSEKDGIAESRQELELLGLYGQELDAARNKLELLNAAKRLGITLTPERQKEIEETANAKAGIDAYKKAVEDLKATSADALKGFISDMREGKTASEALANALDKLAGTFLDAGIDGLVNSVIGGATKPGTGFASLFGFADGGIAANGRPVPLKKFANGGISNTAAIFGEAGPEAAIPLKGGKVPVDLRIPSVPKAVAASSQTIHLTVAPVFHVQNGTPEGVSRLKEDLVPTIRKVVRTEVNQMFDRNSRFAKSGI